MIKFLDGPAAGKVLMLRRAPQFLRVTEKGGEFDALDMPADEPIDQEKLYAYRVAGPIFHAFIDGTGCHGCFAVGEYRLVQFQPEDRVMRNVRHWHKWCLGMETV